MASSIEVATISESLQIPRIINGLWQLAGGHDQDIDIAAAAENMKSLIDVGLTCFDMADHYGDAEIVVGRHISNDLTRPVTALTKWCPAEDGGHSLEKAEVAVNLAKSRLTLARIVLLQYHVWDYTDDTYLHNLTHLHRLQHDGHIQHIGLTNVDTPHLRLLTDSGFQITTNQVSASLIDRRIQRPNGMGEYCKANGISLLCYGTLLGGFISEKWLDRPAPDINDEKLNWSLRKYLRFINAAGGWDAFQIVLKAVHSIALKHNVAIAAVATRYVLDLLSVAAVIVGSRLTADSAKYAKTNLQVFSFSLDNDDRKIITEAQSHLTDIPGDCGDEYRRPPYLTASGDLSHHLSPKHDHSHAIREAISRGQRIEYDSQTKYEPLAGYSRAIRYNNTIHVSGTTAHSPLSHSDPHGPLHDSVGGLSAASQAVHILDSIERALITLGSGIRDVVRTRIILATLDDTDAVSRVHGEKFGREGIHPANTLVAAKLAGDAMKVEIEAWAEVGSGEQPVWRIVKGVDVK